MTNTTGIHVVEEAEASGDVAAVYREWQAATRRRNVPGIYKCFSARPDVLRLIIALSDCLQFSEGKLTRATKEAIATYISALNDCAYCLDAHAFHLGRHTKNQLLVEALAKADLDAAPLSDAERAMLVFAARVTKHAHETAETDIEVLRQHGWTDEQIAEAVYVISLFAMMNRVAGAFGVKPMGYSKLGKLTP